jgi:CDP-glycerol glycerophosphotransferase (TagB/SpsB family)
MKVLLYGDWPLALTYLQPLAEYIKANEPDWVVQFAGDLGAHATPPIGVSDVVITCDELSVAPDAPIKICIFHGMASKGMAFSTARRDEFVNRRQFYAVPSMFHVKLLRDLGVSEDRIFVSGLTKFDSLKRNILYAPTHNPQISAIPVVRDRIYEIPNVKVHLHQETRNGSNKVHRDFSSYYPVHEDREDIADLLGWADTIIGDMGSIVVEALALGKRGIQVINPEWKEFYKEKGIPDNELERLPEIYIPKRYGLVVTSFEDLLEAVNIAPVGGATRRIVEWIKTRTV